MKWLMLLLLSQLLLPSPVLAQQHYERSSEASPHQQGDNLFRDNFTRDNSTLAVTDQWLKESGHNNFFYIVSNILLARDFIPNSSGYLTTNFDLGNNYAFELDVINHGQAEVGISFRRSDPNNTYKLHFYHHDSEIVLSKIEVGQESILKSISFPLTNNLYHPKVEIFDTKIQVWINDQLLFIVDDPQSQLLAGSVGLFYSTDISGSADLSIDNIQVTPITAQALKPVIFIPGIAGSELQAEQDIIWSANDGHGGVFSYAYRLGEKLWVNMDQAIWPGDDDYFDVLRLKPDGQTSAAAVSPNGYPVPQGYGQIDQIFQEMGYTKGINYFLLVYDWRKDVMTVSNTLSQLINSASQQNNQSGVDLVAHSLGGLVARAYLNSQSNSSKVNKLIEIGVPHLGAPKANHDVIYGSPLGKTFLGFTIGVAGSEVRDVLQNFPSIFQLFPSSVFNQFYPPWLQNQRRPDHDFMDDLNPNPTKLAANLHRLISPNNLPPTVQNYLIVGSGFRTLGQVTESWWIDWPIKLIPKTDTTYFNGDGTVPLYSASLKNDILDFSNQAKTYFVSEDHNQLVQKNSLAFNIVRQILSDSNPISEIADPLAGIQLSVDSDAELKIDSLDLDKTGSTTHFFIKKNQNAKKVKIISSNKKMNVKVRHYANSRINKTDYYHQIPVDPNAELEIFLDPADLSAPIIYNGSQQITASAETSSLIAEDQTPPKTDIQINNSLVTLNTHDNGVGTLKTEYSLDDGQTVNLYTGPFSVSPGKATNLQVVSVDKVGNQELPQTVIINTSSPPPSPSPSVRNSNTSISNRHSLTDNQPPLPPKVLAASAVNSNNKYQSSLLVMLSFLYAYLNARRLAGL